MAASSPAHSTKVGESLIENVAVNGNLKSITFDTPKQNLRGLNKPKCSKCGNVARSRCPFQSCKSCCAKAQNPCPIHVLKQNGTLPDKPLPSTIPSLEPQSTDAPSSGASWRLTSLRQLSTTVANSLRVRKALTRKDAANINNWRFSKLREHINGDTEAESEAFERYLQNASLLEEAFSTTGESMKLKLKYNPKRADAIKKRTRRIVNENLRTLQEREVSASVNVDELDAYRDLKRPMKLDENLTEKTFETDALIDKLNKARNKDDLAACLEMKSHLLWHSGSAGNADQPVSEDAFDRASDLSFALPKLCTVVRIDQEVISEIDGQISSAIQLFEL
ncbi:hypothetical protein KSP40_PGU009930 [Platanthera guangdongensis]|uniref:Uncharacterized protein n=1 Tax=Platanthera guangdongensis TaxID=2320717 RepID=A0ABR2LUG5_9ASPA